jgi:hypothetical protein
MRMALIPAFQTGNALININVSTMAGANLAAG